MQTVEKLERMRDAEIMRELKESRVWRIYTELLSQEIDRFVKGIMTVATAETFEAQQGKYHGMMFALSFPDLIIKRSGIGDDNGH